MSEQDKPNGTPGPGAPPEPTDAQRRRRVRARAFGHLRRWVVAGAAGSAAALKLTGCPMVCDPLPPPLECPLSVNEHWLVADRLHVSASWEEVASEWRIRVLVGISLEAEDEPLVFDGPPTLSDATLIEHTVASHDLSFSCQPTGDASEILVTVPLQCGSAADVLTFGLEVTTPSAIAPELPVFYP